MKGTLLEFNTHLNEGIISGEDGRRYSFFDSEWKDHIAPVRGQHVDFAVNDLNQAVAIYLIAESQSRSSVNSIKTTHQIQAEDSYTIWDWTIKCLKNYVNFSGRARRKEYWLFYLFQILLSFILGFILAFAGISDQGMDIVSGLLSLALLLPSLAAGARRLHDVNRSGWWMLISLTIIGLIPLFIWFLSETKPQSNKWGHPAK